METTYGSQGSLGYRHYEFKCHCSVTLMRENIFIVCTVTLAIAC